MTTRMFVLFSSFVLRALVFHVCRIRFSCQVECRSWAAQPFSEDRKVCATDVIEVFADSKEGGRKGERVQTIV